MNASKINGAPPRSVAPIERQKANKGLCSFTVDVEDWYQSSVDFDAPISDRVKRNVGRLCGVLDEFGIKATFFVQGMVAEAFPNLLQELIREGHEIQSHGYSHRPLYQMDRQALRTELEYSCKTIEDACGVKVTAFRAPDFSILSENIWALESLVEAGFEIDSSIFPLRMRRYGIAGSKMVPHEVHLPGGGSILEVPVAVWQVGRFKLPVAGGGYFRLLPQFLLARALRSIIDSGAPAIIYCHPYEFSPDELRAYYGKVSTSFLVKQGVGRAAFVQRSRRLFQEFPFTRFDEAVANWRKKK